MYIKKNKKTGGTEIESTDAENQSWHVAPHHHYEAAFSAITLETQASKQIHILWQRDAPWVSYKQTMMQPNMWRNLELCHVGVGVPGNVEDILGNTHTKRHGIKQTQKDGPAQLIT